MKEAIRLLDEAFNAWRGGKAQNQPRRRLVLPSGSVLHQLTGAIGPYFGTKIYSTNPKHGAWFHVHLYDADTARPLALFDANWLGQIRTGAATGLATRRLARSNSRRVGVIGSGFQARGQLEAVCAVRPIDEAVVWSRNIAKCEAFARDCSPFVNVTVAASPEQAVRDADVVITMTNAKDPVLDAAWVKPGAHVNAAGSNNPARREIPAELLVRADYICADSVEQAKVEAGDLILGLMEPEWARVGELRDGRVRQSESELTVFKSVGIGLEDVAVAGFVYELFRAEHM